MSMILLTSAAVPLLCAGALLTYDLVDFRTLSTGAQRFQTHAVFALVVLGLTAFLAFVCSRLLREFADSFGHKMKVVEQQHGSAQAHLVRMHLLQRIMGAIGKWQDVRSIFQIVLQNVEDDLPVDFCCFCLYDASVEALTVTNVSAGSETLAVEMNLTEQSRVPIDAHGLARGLDGVLIYEPDTGAVGYPFTERLAAAGLRSVVIAPLSVDDRVEGLLIACRRGRDAFISADCEFLQHLCEHVGMAVHQVQRFGALQQAYDKLHDSQVTVLQQERLRALGQMASGIAHDINNAISPVTLYTESLLEREPGLSDRARSYLQTIQRSIEDVARTVGRMREFYRPREPHFVLGRISVNALVDQVLDITRPRWNVDAEEDARIQLVEQLDPAAPEIMGAEGDVRDALTQLILNAVEAMPKGGTLTVSTCAVEVPWPGSESDGPVQLVYLEVADTGVGMDEDTRRRCLEPFFSTKGERGSGLGLAMVYGMVQRHRAHLDIESEPDIGTTVRLAFAREMQGAVVTPLVRELHADGEVLIGARETGESGRLTAMQGRG